MGYEGGGVVRSVDLFFLVDFVREKGFGRSLILWRGEVGGSAAKAYLERVWMDGLWTL